MNFNPFPPRETRRVYAADLPVPAVLPIPGVLLLLACCLLSGLAPQSANGWGGTMHRLVCRAAVDNLPLEMIGNGADNAFAAWKEYIAEHCMDPDNNKDQDPNESARHWLDIDARWDLFPYPFAGVPRNKILYLEYFARDEGVLPWEGWKDPLDRMTEAMRQRNWTAAYTEAAWLTHYIADAHSPMHATVDYNGYLSSDTRNRGIHSRHESTLANRYITSATTSAGSASLIADPVEEAFSTITNSWTVSQSVLAADLAAQGVSGDWVFDSIYYAEFWRLVGAATQKQIDDAARMTASLWFTAWVNAGRPRFSGTPSPSAWIFY